jgi:hypothetical protein
MVFEALLVLEGRERVDIMRARIDVRTLLRVFPLHVLEIYSLLVRRVWQWDPHEEMLLCQSPFPICENCLTVRVCIRIGWLARSSVARSTTGPSQLVAS